MPHNVARNNSSAILSLDIDITSLSVVFTGVVFPFHSLALLLLSVMRDARGLTAEALGLQKQPVEGRVDEQLS